MSLSDTLNEFNQGFVAKVSQEIVSTMDEATEMLRLSGLAEQVVKAGQTAPAFELPELGGDSIELSKLLENGSLVISFYRGAWCPYCSFEMQALQRALPDIKAAGANLIAIAPELPERAGEIRDKGKPTFPLLHDWQNRVARQYGLVFTLPDTLRPIYENFGIDLAESQGNSSFDLPLPATYIVQGDGVVAHAFVDVDYTRRMEPSEIVDILRTL